MRTMVGALTDSEINLPEAPAVLPTNAVPSAKKIPLTVLSVNSAMYSYSACTVLVILHELTIINKDKS